MVEPFYVSAPGKVIIFGEHSAVYGKPAIAAALSLRAFLLATPSEDPLIITLEFPDIKLSHHWNKDDIPWDAIDLLVPRDAHGKPTVTEELIPEIVGHISAVLSDLDDTLHYTACHCFLYLYTNLCGRDTPAMNFSVRSTLPIGAGLGSSASTAVCLSSALALLGGHVGNATYTITEKFGPKERQDADLIDAWSLMGEKCFHGNPSGIDNTVATHGGAVMFQRSTNSLPSVKITMRNFPPIRLLLTNTKVPRSTADLVANVARINGTYSKTSGSILEAMGHLTTDAYQLMTVPSFGTHERVKLRELVNINHGLLVAFGVSHPQLERIKIVGDTIGSTKLTGAGGGGCAITLVEDGVEEEQIQEVMRVFESSGFETFETSLGGKGVGLIRQSDVPVDQREIFGTQKFLNYKDNSEIKQALDVENLTGWKFW